MIWIREMDITLEDGSKQRLTGVTELDVSGSDHLKSCYMGVWDGEFEEQ